MPTTSRVRRQPKPKTFSELFKIEREAHDDWFDVILNADTELFVDPFLIFKDADPDWTDAHDYLIAHFNRAFMKLATASRADAIGRTKALDTLTAREPREFCLGYTARGSRGSGLGREFSERIAGAMRLAIERGVREIKHFEELAIFAENIGADRISDMTCTILKPYFVRYTKAVARRHDVETNSHRLWASGYDFDRDRWQHDAVRVPTNPFANGPILLVPLRFLRRLPTLNPDAWFDDVLINEQLRADLSEDILKRSKKQAIVAAAKAHPELVTRWTARMEKKAADPYPSASDPELLLGWSSMARAFVIANPMTLNRKARTRKQFASVIEEIIERYQYFVTDAGLWRLLWDGNKPAHEGKAQLLFRGIAASYCETNDIALHPEVNLGQGPVDFIFSRGKRFSAMLEVKKLYHSHFWVGLSKQLPKYLKAGKVKDGWYLVLQYGASPTSRKEESRRLLALPSRVAAAGLKWACDLRGAVVDCRKQRSASKL